MRRLAKILSKFPTVDPNSYHCYSIRVPGKKPRPIEAPDPELKALQKELVHLFEKWKFSSSCKARKGFGIQDNAFIHHDATYVLQLDIKSCYPSVTEDLIRSAVNNSNAPSDLKEDILEALDYCLITKDGVRVLPTGAPTSPILCNIALTPLDKKIETLAKKKGYVYTRYIDDLSLSTTAPTREWGLMHQVTQLVKDEGLTVNKKKTRWLTPKKNDKTIITGVRINGPNRVPREFYRMVRAKLNNLAMKHQAIDAETRGCLAYIQAIDKDRYQTLISYYERRLGYEK